LEIFFDNEQGLHGKIATRQGLDIAPIGTFTNDFDWRYKLEEGDMVDCMDGQGIWYRSTILET
jgi:hypothetical protein